jgi:transcriptional regulator with XRE-family HTH domain
MPKYEINRKPGFIKAVNEIREKLKARGITQTQASYDLGISQGNISKLLNGTVKKENNDFILLCEYIGIAYQAEIESPINDPRIQKALQNVFDGTDESIILIARLIECAGILNTVKSRKALK